MAKVHPGPHFMIDVLGPPLVKTYASVLTEPPSPEHVALLARLEAREREVLRKARFVQVRLPMAASDA
ncbi:MAG TPA: hypothetical protein VHA77_12250 [Xanthobacteraceae bacterium]|nr:hypothetical protein [Xanthobacteraceae bacterium]